MSGRSENAGARVALGLRAQRGGAVIVGVNLQSDEPRIVLSSFLVTATEGDRLSREPYHVAFEMERGPDGGASAEAVTAVAEGRKRQNDLAVKGMAEIVSQQRQAGCEPIVAALLVNRAGWIRDLLSYSLSCPDHPPVAEGLAVREALRFALGRCGIEIEEMDEKSLPGHASEVLRLGAADLDTRMKALGAVAGRPWRKEQKLASLAAWAILATSP